MRCERVDEDARALDLGHRAAVDEERCAQRTRRTLGRERSRVDPRADVDDTVRSSSEPDDVLAHGRRHREDAGRAAEGTALEGLDDAQREATNADAPRGHRRDVGGVVHVGTAAEP